VQQGEIAKDMPFGAAAALSAPCLEATLTSHAEIFNWLFGAHQDPSG
jgi:hypothetical protein